MAHMKYSIWEKCPKCGAALTKKKLTDKHTLRIECYDCGYICQRGTLDSGGRVNIVDQLRTASDKTRNRTIDRVADELERMNIPGLAPENVLRFVAAHIRKMKHLPSYKITPEGEVV